MQILNIKVLHVKSKFIRGTNFFWTWTKSLSGERNIFGREWKVYHGNAKAVHVNEKFIAELCLLYTKFGKKTKVLSLNVEFLWET